MGLTLATPEGCVDRLCRKAVFQGRCVQDLGAFLKCWGSSTSSIYTPPVQKLHHNMSDISKAREQAEALDSIDKLQQTSICAGIDTPRIVLCGDHSSVKDSLLEALTQLHFPPRSSDMQCWATELVMRYAANPRIYASIRPDPSRLIVDTLHLRAFRYTSQVVSKARLRGCSTKPKDISTS